MKCINALCIVVKYNVKHCKIVQIYTCCLGLMCCVVYANYLDNLL